MFVLYTEDYDPIIGPFKTFEDADNFRKQHNIDSAPGPMFPPVENVEEMLDDFTDFAMTTHLPYEQFFLNYMKENNMIESDSIHEVLKESDSLRKEHPNCTRFDFEQQIFHCWQVIDHMKNIDNEYVQALRTVYQKQFEVLFDMFEKMTHTGQIR